MSAYSDYKVGAIDYDEYKSAMRRECEDDDEGDNGCWNCAYRNEEGFCEPGEFCPIEQHCL